MKYLSNLVKMARKPFVWFKQTSLRNKVIVALTSLFVLVTLGFAFSGKNTSLLDTTERLPEVELKSAEEIATILDPLPLVGTVRSSTEATILTEASGRVTGVYASLGQFVGRGAIIAEIENSSERAAVLQAQANLARVEDSSDDAQLTSAQTGLTAAQESALQTILSAYATIQDAIRVKADQTFTNPTVTTARYTVSTTDSALEGRIEQERARVQTILNRQQASGATLTTSSDLDAELILAIDELKSVRAYLDMLADSLNKAIPNSNHSASDIATFKAAVNTGRSAVISSTSSLAGSKENLAAKRAAKEVAENSLEVQVGGSVRQDVLIAQASLAAARANLEKKLVRAPFAGTINSLPIETGTFVSAFEPAVTIANNGILEVRAYITERDKAYVRPGLTVTSPDGITGVITTVAPALDPVTKRIEVRIALDENSGEITNGQSLRLLLERVDTTKTVSTPIIPLTAIVFEGNDPYVLTVSEENVLVSLPVTLGVILGERIEVSGIEVTTPIVVDARGHYAGESVTVK